VRKRRGRKRGEREFLNIAHVNQSYHKPALQYESLALAQFFFSFPPVLTNTMCYYGETKLFFPTAVGDERL
jgi:hypothetical protein